MILLTTASIYLICAAGISNSFQYDPFSRSSQVVHYSFEDNDDRDLDSKPDDWTRRRGKQFPSYVKIGIDRKRGFRGERSLRFDVNGGRVICYSPPMQIDSLHSYVIEGYVRTQRLKNDAALLSISLLNHKRQRVQRFLSRPVSGTHKGWVRLRIGPVSPLPNVRFIVIGCHLTHGKMMDIHGRVWFDEIRIGRLPRLSLVSNFKTHFRVPQSPIVIVARVGGLDSKNKYRLRLQIFDHRSQLTAETVRPLVTQKPIADLAAETEVDKPIEIKWELPPSSHGFYSVVAALERNQRVILEKRTAFVVMDLLETANDGEFGWSISSGSRELPLSDLANVAGQSGINWLKYPLWQSVFQNKPHRPSDIVVFFDLLAHRRITPVGLLNIPPVHMRKKFGEKWTGVSEVFTMPPKFWKPSTEPVIARYSSSIRHWQLGGESDRSFVGLSRLPQSMRTIKQEFDKIGRDTRVGFHWDWKTPLPSRRELPFSFLSLSSKKPLSEDALLKALKKSRASGVPRWVLIRPLSKSKYSAEQRGSDLVKRMVAAKAGGAEVIIADDVFDQEHGLLNEDGSPSLVYLPWRTTALVLQGTEYLGSIGMPNGSRNYLFVREKEAVFVLWSKEPKTEELYLGERGRVEIMNIWGDRQPAPIKTGSNRQIIQVGPIPIILRGCSAAVARWRLETKFQVAQLKSQPGGQMQAILGRNTFRQGVIGTASLSVPAGWELKPAKLPTIRLAAGSPFKIPMKIIVPTNASLGNVRIRIDFDLTSERNHKFRVYRSIKIGL
ncbi:MAG: hypothetical protein IID45_11245 [Planctomycetes bacterium]|nr:hypothetical protein [Planctomycetota bacterium]